MTTPQDRTATIVAALMKAYFLTHTQAKAVLDGHTANELRALDQEISKVPNPYRRTSHRRRWSEGVQAAQGLLFWKEMRLRASAENAQRQQRKALLPSVPAPREKD